MGEGEGGGGQDVDLAGSPSPSSPPRIRDPRPTEGRGDFVGLCLFNYGLLSKILRVNLKAKTFKEKIIPDAVYETYLGEKGLGTYLLMKENSLGSILFFRATNFFLYRADRLDRKDGRIDKHKGRD